MVLTTACRHQCRLRVVDPGDVVLLGLAAAGIVARLYMVISLGLIQEDALITFRYARNLWNGLGPVYNPSERVLAATSPLWTVLISPILGLFSYAVAARIVSLLGLLAYIGVVFACLRLSEHLNASHTTRILLVAVLALHPSLVAMSVCGMEAPLFALFVLGSMLCATGGSGLGSYVSAGLAVLTRPEGVIWLGCLVVFSLWRERRVPWKGLLTTVAVVGPWIVFASAYYGSPIPQSALAKSNWISDSLTVPTLLWREASFSSTWAAFTGFWFASLPLAIRIALPLAWWGFFVAAVVRATRRRQHDVLLAAGFVLAYVAFFYFGHARVFEWYYLPAVTAGALITTHAAGQLVDSAAGRLSETRVGPRLARLLQPGVAAAAVVLLMGLLAYKVPGYSASQKYEDEVRRPCGEYLRQHADPADRVMLEPIGYIGFFSGLPVVDLAGLVSPTFARMSDKTTPGWVIDRIRRIAPEMIVLRAYEIPSNAFFAAGDARLFSTEAEQTWFHSHYREDARFGADEWAMVVYRHNFSPGDATSGSQPSAS